jgi:hypothetical protein
MTLIKKYLDQHVSDQTYVTPTLVNVAVANRGAAPPIDGPRIQDKVPSNPFRDMVERIGEGSYFEK